MGILNSRFVHQRLFGAADPFRSPYRDMGKGDSAPAPDYTPLANASKESAEIMAQLGRDQLAQSKQQYDRSMAVVQPVIDAQLDLMKQTKTQGDDQYNYMLTRQRPIEDALNYEAMGFNADEISQIQAARKSDTEIAYLKAVAKENEAAAKKRTSTREAAQKELDALVAPTRSTAAQVAGASGTSASRGGSGSQASGLEHLDLGNRSAGANGVSNYATTDDLQAIVNYLKANPGASNEDAQKAVDGEFNAKKAALEKTIADNQDQPVDLSWITPELAARYNAGSDTATDLVQKLSAQASDRTKAEAAAERGQIGSAIQGLGDMQQQDAKLLNQKYLEYAQALREGNEKLATQLAGQMSGIANGIRSNASKYEGDIGNDISLYTSGNKAIADKYGNDIQFDVDNAIADTRAGQAQATNSAIRQGLRYGISTDAITPAASVSNARALAAAANGTRMASTDKYRGLVGEGIGMKQNLFSTSNNALTTAGNIEAQGANTAAQMRSAGLTDATNMAVAGLDKSTTMKQTGANTKIAGLTAIRDMKTADDSKSFAKKLDVSGLYRGAVGASQGAYGLSNNSGNSAVSNVMAPGQQLTAGTSAGVGTIAQGLNMQNTGLSNIASMQSNDYKSSLQNQSSGIGTALGIAKIGMDIYSGGATSGLWGGVKK